MDPLSPDRERFRPVAILHEGRLRDVVQLEMLVGGGLVAGHRLKVPADASLELLLERLLEMDERLPRLRHARVARFQEHVRSAHDHWFLFDFVEGYPLSHLQPPQGIPADWVAFWLSQMLQAINYLHGLQHVVGGSVPADWLVTSQGLTLVDVGLLELLFPESSAPARTPQARAMLAPEARSVTRYSAAGDLFSVGAIAWWLATGKPPREAAHRTIDARVEALLEACPALLHPAAEAIGRLLEFQPGARGAAQDALDVVAFATPVLEGRPPPPPARPYEPYLLREPARKPIAPVSPPVAPAPTAGAPAPAAEAPPPVGEAAATGDEAVAAPSKGSMGEVLEDVLWAIRLHPVGFIYTVLVVGVLAVVGAWWMGVGAPKPAPPPPILMKLDTGSILIGDGSGGWRGTLAVTGPGLIIAAQKDGLSELSFGHGGRLRLQPKTTFRLDRVSDDMLAMELVNGQEAVDLPPGLTGTITVGGTTVTCPPGAKLELYTKTGNPPEVTLKVRAGTVMVKDSSNRELSVPAGSTAAMGGKHLHPDIIEKGDPQSPASPP